MSGSAKRIDSITHLTPDGNWFGTQHDASLSRLLTEMDAAQIERAVVVALADHIENEFVLNACAQHDDRLIAGVSFNPAAYENEDAARRAFQQEIKPLCAPVLKLHPRLNGYDPLDTRCMALYEELCDWERPPAIWLDTLFHSRRVHLSKTPVESIHQLITNFEKLTFVLLHGCASQLLHCYEAIRDCPNAYLDLSLILPRYFESSIRADIRQLLFLFDRRLIWGSDMPEYTPNQALNCLFEIAEGLEQEKLENVLGRNLAALLNLTESHER